jgi:dihydropteroate synthase
MTMNDPLARLMNLRSQPGALDVAERPLNDCVLCPLGLVAGEEAKKAVDGGLARWIAGGPIAFTAVAISEGPAEEAEVEYRSVRDLARLRDPLVSARLEAITIPRVPMGGLSWGRTRIAGLVDLSEEATCDVKLAISRGRMMAREGADTIAVTMSLAPGALGGEETERARVSDVVDGLAGEGIRVAAFTRNAEVMRAAAMAGARLLGDTGGLEDDEIVGVVADLTLPIIIRPKRDRGLGCTSENAVVSVHQQLEAVIEMFEGAGVARSRLIVDPAIGALGDPEANLAVLGSLAAFHGLGCPIAVGPGRAALVGAITGEPDPARRQAGEIVVTLAAMDQGVQLVVAPNVADVWQAAVAQRAARTGRLGDLR